MAGELITLPVRMGLGATRFWLRATAEAVAVAGNATGKLIDVLVSRRSVHGPDPQSLTPPPTPLPPPRPPRRQLERDGPVPPRRPPSTVPPRRPPSTATPPRAPEAPGSPETLVPAHVSEEPVLIEEFAEPGAEDGAGAELHVEQPWSGYEQMNAKAVIARMADATAAELAAVQLYESGHRRRQTILTAVARELQSANGSGRR
jgi:hypothetical protein